VKKISESAVRRLSLYLRPLRVVAGKQELISSRELAERSGSTSAQRGVKIGIITTPPEAAPDVADRLARAGVSAILNFALVKIAGNEGTVVRTMDLALELEGLTFALTSSRGGERSHA
jgi:NADH/NAD ratio-sensing transcriptional regulator Rex